MISTKSVITERSPLLPRDRARAELWWIVFVISVGLLLLPEVIRLDGKPHADWLQFVGRFHPLLVHLPIGLIVLVPVLEIGGNSRPALREAAVFVLGVAAAACLLTLMLGYLLAYGSGETGITVTRHMWGGIVLTLEVLCCALARSSFATISSSRTYSLLLVVTVLTLVFTAHQGGSLTHGGDYLTRYMPVRLGRLLGATVTDATRGNSFYSNRIHPIFDANCVVCHGAEKSKGGLRLDSYPSLMQGGKDGSVIHSGHPETSMLLERVTLPSSDHHFMPAEGRAPLKDTEIAWLRAWIRDGASPVATTVAGVSLPTEPLEPALQPVGDYSALRVEIQQMKQAQGAKLVPVSTKPSDGLILQTVDIAGSFGDAQLARFQRFAPYIVEAELARTAVTDASFDTLSKFTHLRALHLEGTAVTGSGLAKLAGLSQLSYLNMSETKVTPSAVEALKTMPNLRHVYLFNTPAQVPATGAIQKSTGVSP